MDGYGTTARRVATPYPPSSDSHSHNESKNSSNHAYTFTFSWPFNIPSTPESAVVRIIRNLQKFSLYYAIFIWTVLFITLVPKRKVSVIYLISMTEMAFLYFLLLRALPNSAILHKIIDKRLVLFGLFVITAVELILTGAAIHLLVTHSATIPVVILHAVLSKAEEVSGNEYVGEMTPLVQGKSTVGDQPVDLV